MPERPTLYGYGASTYTRMARLALAEKGVEYDFVPVASWDGYRKNPDHADLHPFRKVPVLDCGDTRIYETLAICTYVDEAYDGPDLQPRGALDRARMAQRISVVISYAWPVWVPVFAGERFFSAFEDRPPDEAGISEAMPQIREAACVIDGLLANRTANTFDLSDIFLAGSFCYLAEALEGEEILNANPALSDWWQAMRSRGTVADILPQTEWKRRRRDSYTVARRKTSGVV